MEKKILSFTGEHAHLNRFQFQLSQVEKRKFIITEPQTGLKVVEGKTEREAMQRFHKAVEGVNIETWIAAWQRFQAQSKQTWIEIEKYENRQQD